MSALEELLKDVSRDKEKLFIGKLKEAKFLEGDPSLAFIDVPEGMDEGLVQKLAQSFRLALLTEVPGWAAVSMRLQYGEASEKENAECLWRDMPFKYGYLPGIVENVRDIAENLRKGIFRLPGGKSEETFDAECSFDDKVDSFYKEILLGEWFEEEEGKWVLNPALTIFTLKDNAGRVWLEFVIAEGRGYRTASEVERRFRGNTAGMGEGQGLSKESSEAGSAPNGRLYLDADFYPVRKVGFRIDMAEGRIEYTIDTLPNRTPKEAYEIAVTRFEEISDSIKRSVSKGVLS